MKKIDRIAIALSAFFAAVNVVAEPAKPGAGKQPAAVVWKLAYTEDFKGSKLDARLWQRIDRGQPDWCKNMSLRDDLVTVKNSQLHCHGVVNNDLAQDSRRVLTGGVMTKGCLAMLYGKIEIRCRLEGQRGAWPAIWMMPVDSQGKSWPECGEIDIVERLNYDAFVYQTVHSLWTSKHPKDPPHGGRGTIRPDDWNVYGLEWLPEKIVWTVNGKVTHSYPRVGDDPARYPWDKPFYLMIDMQLGGKWVGAVDESTLPVAMHVDWVKFYRAYRNGRPLGEIVRSRGGNGRGR